MADTTVQLKAEAWILRHGLFDVFGVPFESRNVKLTWGGVFKFDAVSPDNLIVGNISTSSSRTAGKNLATAKIQKIMCDTLYLLHAAGAKRRFLVFCEMDMLKHFEKCAANGRFPKGIKLVHVPLPPSLQHEVEAARRIASLETSPQRGDAL